MQEVGERIIIKLLGKRIGLRMIQARLPKLWQINGNLEVIDLQHEFFIVRFSNWGDYAHVFYGGP